MIVSGKKAAAFISNAVDPKVQAQGAGYDLTVGRVEGFKSPGFIDFDNSGRVLPETFQLFSDEAGTYTLRPGAYLITFNERVSVPADKVGRTLPRSSLLRCGMTLGCALWDPGYSGRGKVLLIVANPFGGRIYHNARIAQICFEDLGEEVEEYSGVYQGEGTV